MQTERRIQAARFCIVTAADIEYKTVAKLLSDSRPSQAHELSLLRGTFGTAEVTLLRTEIGAPGFANRLRALLSTERYDAALIIGLAGALAPTLKTGDVVIYDHCLDGRASNRKNSLRRDDFASITCDLKLANQFFEALAQSGLRCFRGTGILVERVIIEAAQKQALHEHSRAAAVDMESWLVLEVTQSCNLPSAVLRVVMDEAAHDLPDFNAGLSNDGQIRYGATLQALAWRPLATIRFLLSLRPALRSLRQTAHGGLSMLANRYKV